MGNGGYGNVYEARKDDNPHISYAVKIINNIPFGHKEYMIKTIEREIQLFKCIKSENFIKLLDHKIRVKDSQIVYYLFFEYAEGGSLEEKRKNSTLKTKYLGEDASYLPEGEVIKIMLSIAHTFNREKKLIHRDLKPSSFVIKNFIIKIIDLDFAKYIDNKVTGTYGYKSPEIFEGDFENLSKCDIWSFGIMIFEFLYGSFPWLPKSKVDYQFWLESQKPIIFPEEPEVSLKMKKFLLQILIFDYKDRPNWNAVCLLMDELGFYVKNSSKYHDKVKDIEEYNKNKEKESKYEKEEIRQNFKKFYSEFTGIEKQFLKKNEIILKSEKNNSKDFFQNNNNSPKSKIVKNIKKDLKVSLKLSTFFKKCIFLLNFNFEEGTIFASKYPNFIKTEIFDHLNRFVVNYFYVAKKNLQTLAELNFDQIKFKKLENKILNPDFNFREHENNVKPPNFNDLRKCVMIFLELHKNCFLTEEQKKLPFGQFSNRFYIFFCFCQKIVNATHPGEIFSENEKTLTSHLINDFFFKYESMENEKLIKEIRDEFQID